MYTHRDTNPNVSKVVNEMLNLPASQSGVAKNQQALKPSGQPGGMLSTDPDFLDQGNPLRAVKGPLGERSRRQKKKADASPAVNEAKLVPGPDEGDSTFVIIDGQGNRVPGKPYASKADGQAALKKLNEREAERAKREGRDSESLGSRLSKLNEARDDEPPFTCSRCKSKVRELLTGPKGNTGICRKCEKAKANEHINPNGTVAQARQVNEMRVVPSDSVRNGFYVVDGEQRISGTFIGRPDAQAELGRLAEASDDDKDKKKKKYKKTKGIDAILLGRSR